MPLDTTLGGRLYHWLLNYSADASAGTWAAAAGGVSASRLASAGTYPTVGTTAGGQTHPHFDGTAGRRLQSAALSALPAYVAGHRKVWGFGFRLSSAGAGTNRWIYGVDTHNYYVNAANQLSVAGYNSAALSHDAWHTGIMTWDGSASRMYIDKVMQGSPGSTDFSSTWRTSPDQWFGDRPGGGFPFRGSMMSMFWALDATTAFTQGDVDAIHDDLFALIEGGGGGGPVDLAGFSAGASSASALVAVARRMAPSTAGVSTTAARLAAARRVRAFVAGIASTSATARVTRSIAASSAGSSTTTLALALARRLVANAAGASSTFGAFSVRRSFRVAAAGVGSASVSLEVTSTNHVVFAATSAGVGAATASLVVARALRAAGSGSAATSVAIRVARPFRGTSAASATADAHIAVVRTFGLTSAGFATAIASLGGSSVSPIPFGVAHVVIAENDATFRVETS